MNNEAVEGVNRQKYYKGKRTVFRGTYEGRAAGTEGRGQDIFLVSF